MDVIEEIKQRLDIVEVISAYVPLKKAGRNFKGLCPFHTEKTPSFVVFPHTQTWHCFGACSTGGDIFTFIMRRENMDFAEALRFLAQRAGVTLQPRTPKQAEEEKRREKLLRINTEAAQYFHDRLRRADEALRVREYLEKRGITRETIGTFQLGYALDQWHGLSDYLMSRGYTQSDLLAAGLVLETEDGRVYDRFRARIIFPIRDIRGRIVGFGGRVLDDSVPKYLNSPQTLLFDKGSILYGIDLAKDWIRREGRAIIVEGYMDVLMAHQNGFRNVVASMGTALTERQLRILKRLTKNLTLALDADAAGDQGTLRGLETAKQAMNHRTVPVLTGEGLVRYEDRLDADIRIMALPRGRDPDEIIREDTAAWRRLVEEALPVMDYYFRALTDDLDLNTAKGKRTAVQRLLPLIGELGNIVEREHYLQQLARMLRVDERTLSQQMLREERKRRRGEQRVATQEIPPTEEKARLGLEEYCLLILLRVPSLLHEEIDLNAEDFLSAENRELYTALRRGIQKGEGFDIGAFMGTLDMSLRGHVESLLAWGEEGAELTEEQLREDFNKVVSRLPLGRRERLYRELSFLIQDAQEQGDMEAVRSYQEKMRQLALERRIFEQKLHAETMLGRQRKEVRW